MASILSAAGFKNLESLEDFSNRFPSVSCCLDAELEKVWICHKNPENIPTSGEINSLPSEDYYNLSKEIKKKVTAGKYFYNLLTEFSAVSIFEKIYSRFSIHLTTYLFTKCYLFYNWGINAFEPVIDHFVIHSKIQERGRRPPAAKRRVNKYNFLNRPNIAERMNANNDSAKEREKSVDLFEEPSSGSRKHARPKRVSFKSVAEALKKAEKFYDISKNSKNPYHEIFSLKNVLYSIKQVSHWPRKHVLSRSSVEDLIIYIIKIPVVADSSIEEKLMAEQENWLVLRELMSKFLKNHEVICKNNGYGRILKKHLKSVKIPPGGGRLRPIPKPTVCSYLLDVLRRVLPLELFGRTRVRRHFFSGLVKVVNGNKDETFTWHSLLRPVLANKSDLSWAAQLGDHHSQSRVVLKLFKFLVLHYAFVILRSYFYVTETGSSGRALRYYRKGDVESASDVCLSGLLRNGHVRAFARGEADRAPVERNWLDTGRITRRDLKRRAKRTMDADAEYEQPIARVRFLPKSEAGDELRMITSLGKKPADSSGSNKKLVKFFQARLSRRKRNLFLAKLFLEFLLDKVGFGFSPLPCNPRLEAAWRRAVHLKEKFGKLYFVKADISDAYGSVKHSVLTEVLRGAFEREAAPGTVQLMKIIEWKRVRGRIQKVARFSFGNRPKEGAVMMHRSVYLHHDREIHHRLDGRWVEIVKQVATRQRVQVRGRVFELTRGLAQGSAGQFSTQLCEIYYSAVDGLFFGEFVDSRESVFLRGVDDYLFATSDPEKAKRFLQLVRDGFAEYGVRFNADKLQSNLIDDVVEVPYLGLIFNFEEMSVRPNYSKYHREGFLSTMNLSDRWDGNHFNKQAFLQKRSLRVNCLKLHPIVVNGRYNDLKTIRRTVFEACLTQSLRVVTLANYLYPGRAKNDLGVYETLAVSCGKIKRLVPPGVISAEEVDWLFFFAASTVLRKYSGQFKLLLLVVRFRLQKCERQFARKDAELLFRFLKGDILDEAYWEKLRGVFKELGKSPLKTI